MLWKRESIIYGQLLIRVWMGRIIDIFVQIRQKDDLGKMTRHIKTWKNSEQDTIMAVLKGSHRIQTKEYKWQHESKAIQSHSKEF